MVDIDLNYCLSLDEGYLKCLVLHVYKKYYSCNANMVT